MQPLTFACPKCGRRMGVGLELTGRQVRCPHCRQVVIVPTSMPPKPPAASETPAIAHGATPPEAFAPSTEGDIPLPSFAPQPGRREGAESIFGDSEHEEDSLFAAPSAPRPLLPDLPSSTDLVGTQPSGAIDFNTANAERQAMPPTDAIESGDIPRPILGPATPFIKKDLSQPDFTLFPKLEPQRPAPVPAPAPLVSAPPPAKASDPWAKLNGPPASNPAPPAPASGRRLAPLVPPPAGRGTLFWVLVSYAAAVTLFAAWGWTRNKNPHPLSTIPDFFGQYRQTDPKKVSALPVDPNQPIPAELRVKLGERLALGELEFEPIGVEERRTKWEGKAAGLPRDVECLVLKARVRNLSKTHAFCPLDPAYNRFATADAPSPLSAVIVGTERFPGGPIPWPFVQGVREYIVGQEQDDQPLQPGKDRTTVIPSIDGDRGTKLREAVRSAKGPLLWQVHVRRGFTTYQGEEVSVGALIGVEFTATDVKRLDPAGKAGGKPLPAESPLLRQLPPVQNVVAAGGIPLRRRHERLNRGGVQGFGESRTDQAVAGRHLGGMDHAEVHPNDRAAGLSFQLGGHLFAGLQVVRGQHADPGLGQVPDQPGDGPLSDPGPVEAADRGKRGLKAGGDTAFGLGSCGGLGGGHNESHDKMCGRLSPINLDWKIDVSRENLRPVSTFVIAVT
ncbi:hypothetical protein PX52LOC_01345 [Limnoglobus roseus]|uniref:Uncharacterized protein n=1 Tax=Limnoglobus roseus TaxID=2598579 RepID=A0A5C1A878_9BACT|nr:hypothetical protein PX52LOC_01345 [Limnoglobus roseus]